MKGFEIVRVEGHGVMTSSRCIMLCFLLFDEGTMLFLSLVRFKRLESPLKEMLVVGMKFGLELIANQEQVVGFQRLIPRELLEMFMFSPCLLKGWQNWCHKARCTGLKVVNHQTEGFQGGQFMETIILIPFPMQ